MKVIDIERWIARKLPSDFLRDLFPRGMRRLAEIGIFKGQALTKTNFDFLMYVDRIDAVKYYIYYFGQFEPQISLAWKRLLNPGDRVIDIGGNVGYYALLAAKLVGPGGQVATFEPSNRIFNQLKRNVSVNKFANITAFQNAVSNVSGPVKLYYGGDSAQGNSSFFNADIAAEHEIVECITFKQVAERFELKGVKIIKIDVEGAEPLVLEGLVQVVGFLDQDVVIFLEISPENIDAAEEMLKPFFDLGFKAKVIANEYSPKFYNETTRVELKPLQLKLNQIADLMITRDESRFVVASEG